jgi:mannose/fructose/N-acetylgalactosamine-specific phosphotransferase system component IID
MVGGLAVLWYVSGAYTIQMAQLGLLPDLAPDEAAYYAAKPIWFEIATGIATYGSLLGAILLLLRRRFAVRLFGVALAFIVFTNAIEFADGTSRSYVNTGAATVNAIIAATAVLMVFYALAMRRRGVLR